MCYFTSYIIFMHVPRKLLFIAALSKVLSEKYFRNAENNDAELFKLSVNCQLILIRLISKYLFFTIVEKNATIHYVYQYCQEGFPM